MIRSTLRALAFLSRCPVPARVFTDAPPLAADAATFPLAGSLLALPAAGALALATLAGLSPTTGAALAVAALVLVTGALHEDGIADTADALGGQASRERALAILKDSRIGAYGATALVLSLLLRVLLLAEVATHAGAVAPLALLGVAAASRGCMAQFWTSLPPATEGGLAARAGSPARKLGNLGLALGLALLAGPAYAVGGVAAVALPAVLAALALVPFRRMLRRRLGGVTGDTLGAAQQIAELALLLGLALTRG